MKRIKPHNKCCRRQNHAATMGKSTMETEKIADTHESATYKINEGKRAPVNVQKVDRRKMGHGRKVGKASGALFLMMDS